MHTKFPQRIEIEVSNSCNLCCTYCPRQYLNKPRGFIDRRLFEKIIDEASLYSETTLVLHRRGESLLHPDFINMCGYVKGKFADIQLATNATLLDNSNSKAIIEALSFISFSIDVPQVFNKTRLHAEYIDVERRIFNFLALNKRKIKTQVSLVKTKDTGSDNIEIFKKKWAGKVDRVRIYEEHSINGVFGSLRRPRQRRNPCIMPDYELLVYYDGKVGRCNHDWNGEPMGDVRLQKISEIWCSDKYEKLRHQQAGLEITDEVCANCDSWYAEAGIQGTGEVIIHD